MAIEYPKDDKADSALNCAMSHPTFAEGLGWLMAWEHENAIKRHERVGISHDRCFDFLINRFLITWVAAGRPIEVAPAWQAQARAVQVCPFPLGGHQPVVAHGASILPPPNDL